MSRRAVLGKGGFLLGGTKSSKTIYRILDANLNRAAEGVRTVEDTLRFLCGDARSAAALRDIRHSLREGAKLFPGSSFALLQARDSFGDVARNAPPKTIRENPETVIAANLKRAQEAARVLEEYSRLVSPRAAVHFGSIRFRLYDIEKDIAASSGAISSPRPIPSAPFFYAVADYQTLSGNGSFDFLIHLVSGGAGMIQLREKNLSGLDILNKAKTIAKKISGGKSLFVVNDRADIAIAAGADVVHSGQEDIPADEIRRISGDMLRVGVSTHSMIQAEKAIALKPDYISVGPVFSSPTKPEKRPVGLKLLKNVIKEAGGIPVVAIGGISLENVRKVFGAGASGAAMISALSNRKNPDAIEKINMIIDSFK